MAKKDDFTEKLLLKGLDAISMHHINQSVKELTANVQQLTQSFTTLNSEMQKSNKFFEKMNKSSIAVEKLTLVLVVFTILLTCLALAPVLKDTFCMDPVWALGISFVIPTLIFYVIYRVYKNKKED